MPTVTGPILLFASLQNAGTPLAVAGGVLSLTFELFRRALRRKTVPPHHAIQILRLAVWLSIVALVLGVAASVTGALLPTQISGVVEDENHNVIEHARVSIDGIPSTEVETQANGNFSIEIPTNRRLNDLKIRARKDKLQGVIKVSDPTDVHIIIAGSSTTRIDFDQADTRQGSISAEDYLHQFGISISDVTENTDVAVLRDDASYGGLAFAAPSAPNVLTQLCPTTPQTFPVTFTLRFNQPVYRLTFVRARLLAVSPSGITHPAWSARAFDADGKELSNTGEHLVRNVGVSNNEPARTFTLEGPNIVAVRFDSDNRLDGKPFAAFCAVLIDNLALTR